MYLHHWSLRPMASFRWWLIFWIGTCKVYNHQPKPHFIYCHLTHTLGICLWLKMEGVWGRKWKRLRPPEEEKEEQVEEVEATWQSDGASWRASTLATNIPSHLMHTHTTRWCLSRGREFQFKRIWKNILQGIAKGFTDNKGHDDTGGSKISCTINRQCTMRLSHCKNGN